MTELTSFEIDKISGGIDWGQLGNACACFGGAALTMGNVPVAAALGIAAIVCYSID